MRNLSSGNTFEQRFSATEYVDEVRLDTKEYQVLYRDETGVHVMDANTFDQFAIPLDVAGDAAQWLDPEMQFQAETLDGQVVGIRLPAAMEYTIVETAPVMKTATKTASTKPATLNNGVTVQVPEFLSEGERVRVDPRSGQYLERAK